MTEVSVRALRGSDVLAARALVSAQFGGTPYEVRLLEQLEFATKGDDVECRALVGGDERLRGLALFGAVAGAGGVVKLHALVGDDRSALRALATAVRDTDARLVVCEIADDASFTATDALLRELGFAEAGRVADYFRDGVALVVLSWRSVRDLPRRSD
jgi:hypothetical protein